MALVTVEELAAKMRTTLDEASAAMAVSIAASTIQTYTGQHIEATEHTDFVPVVVSTRTSPWPGSTQPPASWSRFLSVLVLHQRPVVAVDSVTVDGVMLAESEWWWGGGQRVWLSGVDGGVYAEVTYTAGYDPIPDDIKAVALALAADEYSTTSPAVASEQLGDYQVSYRRDAATLNRYKAILDRYRPRSGTVRVG